MGWFVLCWKKSFVFAGRAHRREFWWFQFFNLLFALIIQAIWTMSEASTGGASPGLLRLLVAGYSLAAVFPRVAVTVRRLHDVGKSGWNLLWECVPVVGWILLLVFYCRRGEEGANRYGACP